MADWKDLKWQAGAAWRYAKGDRSIIYDPASKHWIPVVDVKPPQPESGPGLSPRALERIAVIQDAERRGILSHDDAEKKISTIVDEES